jgi:DNA-directed RNA polymerase subunit RPC12/RpoP
MRNGPLLQYYCSSCGKILNESSTLAVQKEELIEECPGCGDLLSSTLQNMELFPQLSQSQQVPSDVTPKSVEHLSVDFQTAYRQIQELSIRFAFDIKKIDPLLDLEATGTLCIVGEQKYTQTITKTCFINPLFVRSTDMKTTHL